MKKTLTILVASLLTVGIIGFGTRGTFEAKENKRINKQQVNDRLIPYPKEYDLTEGAAGYVQIGDHAKSPYFTGLDYFQAKSTKNRVLLEEFKTYQQTKEYSCGPASALMILHHFGEESYEELSIAEQMKTHVDIDGDNKETKEVANERGEWGTSTDRIVSFFKEEGWDVQSSLESPNAFAAPEDFKAFVIKHLKKDTPVMVEWSDWSGHWQNIIGYDEMGTKDHVGDDILILADPYDTSDHKQDGYYIYNAERFFYMWHDDRIMPESQSDQQWVVAKPADM